MEVTLRPATEGDISALYEHQADPVVAEMAAMPVRDPAAFDAHMHKVLADPAAWVYAVEVDGRVVGSIMSWDAEGKREIGYLVAREHWGRGIASAALTSYLAIEHARPLWAYVASHNLGSQRVLEKNGFARLGTEQQDVEMVIFRLMAPMDYPG
jgi:RimJ/RimL family protein N-acetyltransferase